MSNLVKRDHHFILEKGYRPVNTVNPKNPPKGGSAVPSVVPSYPGHNRGVSLNKNSDKK